MTKELTNEEIAQLVLFETKEEAKTILTEYFPNKHIIINVYSTGDTSIHIDDRTIRIKQGEY